jgi:hypothetical protein
VRFELIRLGIHFRPRRNALNGVTQSPQSQKNHPLRPLALLAAVEEEEEEEEEDEAEEEEPPHQQQV